jgi:hypothetical protein
MLSVLNKNKICMIDSFWVKVDMDNNFCDALDAKRYPNEYTDLLNNAQSNTHIMHFLSQDEPVLDALSGIRNGSLTWDEYQGYVSRKGGQGICFRTGTDGKFNETNKQILTPRGKLNILSRAHYMRNFLHFELYAYGYANGDGVSDNIRFTGTYEWEGVCKGSGISSFNIYPNYWIHQYTIYSGGSALYTAKLRTTTNTYNYGQGFQASINY